MKGKHHTIGEHQQMEGIPATWQFSKSNNGWTTNELTIEWLESVFHPNTTLSMPSAWHLLIVNRHRSHISTKFLNTAWHLHIVPLLFLPHSTHLMQLLDISVFGPLTATYCHLINSIAQHVVTDINKSQFISFYTQACELVLMQMAAQKAFSDSRMTINLDPKRVLNQLPGYVSPILCQSEAFQ
ncbi:related to transposase [Sporisorium scitamineum]|uniref:Related to transposase n=1 Tax=Sporisorium scitamineum TaxID=49012 RepID=A0A127Z6R7_9BASI|nr:related to transposase [Sporisorium scitamineum]